MRFKGTLVLLIICLLLGGYLYFYEIKGGEKREEAKEAENQVWKLDSSSVRQIDIVARGERISAKREGESNWVLTSPRSLAGDPDELDRLANSASNIRRENVVEPEAADLTRFGLNPPQSSLRVKMKDGKEYGLDFGSNNPTGNSAYAIIPGKKEVFLVSSAVVSAFDKTTDELRDQRVLDFSQPDALSLSIKSPKGELELSKDADDRWWIAGKDTVAADSPGIRGILNALSLGRVKGFFNEDPEQYANLGLNPPNIEVRVVAGKNKAIKRLVIGREKSSLRKKSGAPAKDKGAEDTTSELYLAKDESRPDLFFVEKSLVDKLLQTRNDVRDRALAALQRWEVDYIVLNNTRGNFTFVKSGGEWFMSDGSRKAKWEAVNAILDAMEKPVKEWIDRPAPLSVYGLDKPEMRIVLKKKAEVLADCSFGKAAKDGIYAQVKGDSSVKVADPEGLDMLNRPEADYLETSAPAAQDKGAAK